MMPESMNYNTALSDATLNDAAAAANVTYIGGHFYGGTPRNKYTLALNQKKHIWQTEHYITGDGASSCMSVAKEIMDCLNNLDFNGYVWWWMTYNSNDGICSGSTPNHRGWVLAQFAKWARPGYIRVGVTPYSVQSGVNAVAFRGAQNVVMAMNNNTSSQSVTFSFSGATVTSVHKYTSSQSKNGADDGTITATNNSFTATLDAQSVTTFVSAGTVGVMPVPEHGLPAIGIARPGAASQFMYLVNGRQLWLDGAHSSDRPVSGIYIFPGQSTTRSGAGKVVKMSGR
jgi:glucuronoarabinoxylan endo-1,4-beta-xylanase